MDSVAVVAPPPSSQEAYAMDTSSSDAATDGASATAAPPAVPIINYEIVPSLRGMVTRDPTLGGVGSNIRIKGLWAMIDSQHNEEGKTSEFELTLQETFTPANILNLQGAGEGPLKETALSGKYKGWFKLKRISNNGSDSIQEKDVILSFNSRSDGGFDVTGEGSNKFGPYILKGHVDESCEICLYRQYVKVVGGPPPAPSPRGGKKGKAKKANANATGSGESSKAGIKTKPGDVIAGTASANKPRIKTESAPMSNHRDGAGRDRKKSAIMDDAYGIKLESQVKPAIGTDGVDANGIIIGPSNDTSSTSNNRTQRLSQQLLRCSDLLKEMVKIPLAFYFLEPVDPIKLGIPEYANVIETPMDFTTIREKLFGYSYNTPIEFAADVRLVFRNAITFNQMKDNPVHIAARECSAKFEERFRLLMTSSSITAATPAEQAAYHQRMSRPAAKSKPKAPKRMPQRTSLAPDGSMAAMQEMQQRMLAMANEITTLRTSVNQDAVIQNLDQRQAEAQHPLTYAEKKTLIADINKLDPEYMERVIEMVSAATPDNGDDDIEVPLDELDTATLRGLQRYVASVNAPKKVNVPKQLKQQPKPEPNYIPAQNQTTGGGFGVAAAPVAAPAPAPAAAPMVEDDGTSDMFIMPDDVPMEMDMVEPATSVTPNDHHDSSPTKGFATHTSGIATA
jgi:hypothetical protein